jgi:hypothetical protein
LTFGCKAEGFYYLSGISDTVTPKKVGDTDTFAISAHCRSNDRDTRRDRFRVVTGTSMDSCTEYLGTRSMLCFATGFAADSRNVGLVRSGPYSVGAQGCDWPVAPPASLPLQNSLHEVNSVCLLSPSGKTLNGLLRQV